MRKKGLIPIVYHCRNISLITCSLKVCKESDTVYLFLYGLHYRPNQRQQHHVDIKTSHKIWKGLLSFDFNDFLLFKINVQFKHFVLPTTFIM